MRILHFADLHLGVENYNAGINPETGLSMRLHDFLNALDEVADYALNNDVDLVLFCGDAYKSREPSPTHQREFARRVWKLASNGIAVLLLTGNHDLPNAIGRATTIEIFKTLSIPNVIVANTPGTYKIDTKNGSVQIVALPWARRSGLLSRELTKNLSAEEVNEQIQNKLTDLLLQQIDGLDPKLPAVLAAHVTTANARYGSERGMIMGNDYRLLQSNIANPAFDYVALGHIHKKQVLGENPPIVYSGSLQRIDFSEEDDDKGFFIVDIERGDKTKFEFVPVKARRFVTVNVELGGQEPEPTETVLNAIKRHDVADAIVRVQISMPERLAKDIDDYAIRKALQDAYYVASISRDVSRERRPRLSGLSPEGLQPIDALKAYYDAKKPALDIELLLEYGRRIIDENRDESENAGTKLEK
ncbi:MAG: exonuclease SbcCD subunit D [Dehalococcoidia bacterium]|jgi:exonuclease SbcD